MKPPLIRINSDHSQFVMKTLNKDCNFNQFRRLTSVNIDLNERNVFVEAGSGTKMSELRMVDVILLDKVSHGIQFVTIIIY